MGNFLRQFLLGRGTSKEIDTTLVEAGKTLQLQGIDLSLTTL